MKKHLELFILSSANREIFLEVIDFIKKINSEVISIIEINKGDNHYVYQFDTDISSYYLKIRKKYCKDFKDILLNPEDIKKEKLALDLLNILFPDNFPKVLQYNESKNYFLMNDVINSGVLFIDFLNGTKSISKLEKFIIKLGKILGNIHFALGEGNNDNVTCNNGHDNNRYNNRLNVILGNNDSIIQIIEALKKEKKQLILGDLSPKNIGLNEKNDPVFFDLEYFGNGSCVFEVAFFLSHIYLHLYDLENNKKILNLFLNSYQEINRNFEISDLFWEIFYSSIMYRVGISPMRYNVTLSLKFVEKIREESRNYLK